MIDNDKKILVVINNLAIGGAERVIVDDVNEMIDRSLNIKLLSLRSEKNYSFKNQCKIKAENWELIEFKSFFHIKSWINLYIYLKNYNPDIVISHMWYPNTIIRIISFFYKIPFLLTFEQNVYDNIKSWKCFFMDWLLQARSTYIIAVSNAVKRSLMAHGISEKRIKIIFNAIDEKRYNTKTYENYYEQLKIDKDEFIFIFVGRLDHQKGVDVLLKAFSYLDKGILLLIGSGPDGGPLKKMSEDLDLSDRVFFLWRREDIAGLMNIAQCGVFPSRWEGLPLVLLEAMACHVPFITTDFESAKEFIVNEYNAIVVKRESEIELATAMKRVMDDELLRRKIIAGGDATVVNFLTKNHINSLLDLTNYHK